MKDEHLRIHTTDGKLFGPEEHRALARLIYQRYGCDAEAATAAWRRMLQNNATSKDFMAMVEAEIHPAQYGGYAYGYGSSGHSFRANGRWHVRLFSGKELPLEGGDSAEVTSVASDDVLRKERAIAVLVYPRSAVFLHHE